MVNGPRYPYSAACFRSLSVDSDVVPTGAIPPSGRYFPIAEECYSHSMVLGGLELMS